MRLGGVMVAMLALTGCPQWFMSGGDDHPQDAAKDGPPLPPAQLVASTTSIDVPPTVVGTSQAFMFELVNHGGDVSGPATVSSSDATSFTVGTTCAQVPANAMCEVFGTFTPVASGTLETDITVAAIPGGTTVVRVTGVGAQPANELVVSPEPLDLGGVPLGGSTMAALTVTNQDVVATGPLRVDFTLASHFVVAGDTCSGISVPPKGACTLAFAYAPGFAIGPTERAHVVVSAIPGGITTGDISAFGYTLGISPRPYVFPATALGATASQTFTITNGIGAPIGPLATQLLGSTSDFAISADTCYGTTLAHGASCTLDIAYAPTVSGTESVELDVQGYAGFDLDFAVEWLAGNAP